MCVLAICHRIRCSHSLVCSGVDRPHDAKFSTFHKSIRNGMSLLNYSTIIPPEQTIGEIQKMLLAHGVLAYLLMYEMVCNLFSPPTALLVTQMISTPNAFDMWRVCGIIGVCQI